jgi:ATP/maltotriose-dependent transcriptional regulator MalT
VLVEPAKSPHYKEAEKTAYNTYMPEYPKRNIPGAKPTQRELDCLQLAADGKSSIEIGEALNLSRRTVDFHLGNLYGKLQVKNRMTAVKKAQQLKLIV